MFSPLFISVRNGKCRIFNKLFFCSSSSWSVLEDEELKVQETAPATTNPSPEKSSNNDSSPSVVPSDPATLPVQQIPPTQEAKDPPAQQIPAVPEAKVPPVQQIPTFPVVKTGI